MSEIMEFDTIAAISTPPGEGAISIIRLSGNHAIDIVNQVFSSPKTKIMEASSHTIHYGHIIDEDKNELLDEVLVSLMREPKTFTKENVVEINCHGGIVVVNQVLQLLLRKGARLAEPGEFTKRAFLNGRIDLSQAEAVMDLIRAKTDKATANAIHQLDGGFSKKIRNLRQKILDVLAQVEVNIDYPEYDDVEEITTIVLKENAAEIQEKIQKILASAQQGKILREGLKTVIIGRPNVGKSSLLNCLLREDKAIVTDIEGTTRDIVEEYINIRGIPLNLIDTAGIRETTDKIEKIGVERSRKVLSEADLLLLVLDQGEILSSSDQDLLASTKQMNRIILMNKSDLPSKISKEELTPYLHSDQIIFISVKNNTGFDQLEEEIESRFLSGRTSERDATYVSNVRHISLLEQAEQAIQEVLKGIDSGMPVDLVQIDMTRCWDLLGEIIGESVQDELITELFSQFCLGK